MIASRRHAAEMDLQEVAGSKGGQLGLAHEKQAGEEFESVMRGSDVGHASGCAPCKLMDVLVCRWALPQYA